MRRIILSLLTIMSICGASSAAETIKFVSSLPRSGAVQTLTQSMVNGIRMAIDDVGGQIQLGGTTYTLAYEDWDDASPARGGNWDPGVEKNNALKAVNDPDVMAYLGAFNSGATKMSMPILNQAGLAMISSANTAPSLTKPGTGDADEPARYRPTGRVTYFRVVPADDIQGAAAAEWAKDLGAKKVFILHDKEAYGASLAAYFRKNAERLGLTIAGFEGIDVAAANYRPLATKIRSCGADLVFFGGTVDTRGGQIAKDLHASGVKAKLILPDGCCTSALISAAGADALNGRTFITFPGVPADQLVGKGKDFATNYRKRFSIEPEAYAAYAYEAALVVLDALHRAGKKDRAALITALAETKDFEGALGRWSFDSNGDTSLRIVSGNAIKDGVLSFDKIIGH